MDWLELRATLGGRRAIDAAFVARALARDLAYADSLERDAATRRLSNIGAFLSFYAPRAFLVRARPHDRVAAARGRRSATAELSVS